MRWTKVFGKFVKTGLITAIGGAIAAVQAVPPGQPINWQAVAISALSALIAGGSIGAGSNYAKHRKNGKRIR